MRRRFKTLARAIQSKSSTPIIGDTIEITSTDGSAAVWAFRGTVGQTIAQTPAQLVDALFNDGSGNQWALVPLSGLAKLEVPSSALGDVEGNEANLTLVLAAAVAALKVSGGGVLKLGGGTKTLEDRLSLPDNITVEGIGIDVTNIVLSTSFPIGKAAFINDTISVGAYTYGNSNINFKKLTISGGGNTGRLTGLVDLLKTKDSGFEEVKFKDSDYFGITDAGNLNLLVRACKFDNLGKSTGASPAIWSQSYLADNTLSIGTKIVYSDFTNNNRSAIQAASREMIIGRNTFSNNGESTIFMNTNALGCIITNNIIKRANLTDISAHGIEVGGSGHIIAGNNISDTDGTGISTLDVTNSKISNNTIENYRVDAVFYSATWSASGIGVTNTVAGVTSNLTINDNTIIKGVNGVNAIVVFHAALSTPCEELSIIDNNLTDGGSGDAIHYQSSLTEKLGINCTVRGNQGHISNSGAVLSFQAGTGVGDYTHSALGFPPHKLRFKAVRVVTNEQSNSDGVAMRGGQGFTQYSALNSSTGLVAGGTQGSFTVIRIDDSNGTTLFRATISDFEGGDGLGFKITKSVATINPLILLDAEP